MVTPVFTVGHGRLQIELFKNLLEKSRVAFLFDVRSVPSSRWSPDYNRQILQKHLAEAGIGYQFVGDELGGRPPESQYYDSQGHVLYKPLSESPRFQSGIRQLLEFSAKGTVAVLCSESVPDKCHRNLLIGRVLMNQGTDVVHLLHDGTQQNFDISLLENQTLDLFSVSDQWRSLVQVKEV